MANEIDVDPQETREWLESLDSAMEREGAARAHYLIERLIDQARRSGAHLPYTATTAYVNTIRKSDEEKLRGEPGLEHRLRSIVRWNALAMVVKANLVSKELGGFPPLRFLPTPRRRFRDG
jgi:pyruvate dehydrogenase E1 component